MSDQDDFPSYLDEQQQQQEDGDLDNPLRVLVVINVPEGSEKETSNSSIHGEMEERLLDNVQSFKAMNEFFDDFDDKIAYPNEGHIKYEVGSDGLVVIVVDNIELRNKVLSFMDKFTTIKSEGDDEDEEEEDNKRNKKSKKNVKA
ncbi:hypothetical protein DFJ63DRAFT_71653 [Scheffersomyces coipomensis]|uniref:uncharacterized protein n=1 Tax=Scheffersomyces coipomensis TaxID=1788519 RepID=UPI00315D7351